MPLLLPFKRAAVHERVLQLVVYPLAVLLAGAVLVPFVMVAFLSFGDVEDWYNGRKWPDLRHFTNHDQMYKEYLATRYDYWPSMYGFDDFYGGYNDDSATILGVPTLPALEGHWEVRAADGLEALRTRLPWTHTRLFFTGWFYYRGSGNDLAAFTGLSDEAWKSWLRKRYRTIEAVNEKFDLSFPAFAYVKVPGLPDISERPAFVGDDPWTATYVEFASTAVEPAWRMPLLGDRAFRIWLMAQPETKGDLAVFNGLAGTAYKAWTEVRLDESAPALPGLRKFWEGYVRKSLSPYFIELRNPAGLEATYRAFVASRHGGPEAAFSLYGGDAAKMALAPAAAGITSATQYGDWDAFVRTVPLDRLAVASPETLWHRFLRDKYGTIDKVREAYGTNDAAIESVPWPMAEIDRFEWDRNRWRYTAEVVFKNYRRVMGLFTDASSAIWNTARFALLFTFLAVMVNGCAAYVLSRFSLGPIQMSLVFFLALAAFPLEAIAVPNFILLRGLGLLNSVWALVLPTAVNGYYIYLLKSFFDSIPKSFMEEAVIEGAGEWNLFWSVAMPLARPMLSVVGLYAFLWSYSNFMWALIVCQQRTQWTMPVLIFNMTTWTSTPMQAAAMVIALLPPLVVFAAAHRTLQRSLSLPRF